MYLRKPFVIIRRVVQEEYDAAIRNVIRDSAFIGNDSNKYVSSFEENFAAFCGARHVIGCANGTDAIEIGLRALDIGVRRSHCPGNDMDFNSLCGVAGRC